MSASEPIQWKVQWRIDKYRAEDRTAPYETISDTGNLLVYGGASALWQRLIGTGVTAFDNSNAHLGVGDSSTAAAATAARLHFANSSHDFNPVTGRAKAAASDQAGVPALRKRS